MTMKSEGPARVPANVAKALAPAVAAFSVAAPAFAEGTGEVRLTPSYISFTVLDRSLCFRYL